jgi:hypothetical protein
MGFEVLAFVCTAFFASACVWVSFVEHPARLACPAEVALAQWRPSYKRAAAMQIALVMVGSLSAVAAAVEGRGSLVVVAGILLFVMAPYTLIVIMPTNRKLLDTSRPVDASTAALLRTWGRLHLGRTAASLIAVAILAVDIARHS